MSYNQRMLVWCRRYLRYLPTTIASWRLRVAFVFMFVSLMFSAAASSSTSALTTVPTKMHFQGRLTNATGNLMADGTYNMKLRLFTVSTGGSSVWSEDRLVSATQGVTVTNGLFSIKLGDITSLPASHFASGSLYLEVELPTPATATSSSPTWTEGPMTPRNQMATSAYAYNAETLDGLDSADFGQLVQNNTWTGDTTFNKSVGSFLITNHTSFEVNSDGIYLNAAGDGLNSTGGWTHAGNLVTNSSQMQFNLSSHAAAFAINDNVSNGLMVIDSINKIVRIGSSTADATAVVHVLDTKNTAGDPTGSSATVGAMYYNSSLNKFRCYENGAWANCITPAGSFTLQTGYTASTGSTTPEIKLDSTRGAFDIQDADTSIAGSLFTVRGSNGSGLGASLFDVSSAAGGVVTILGNNSGEVGSWSTASNALTAARMGAASVIANGYMYVIGGATSGVVHNTVYYSKLSTNGSVGSWSTTSTLPVAGALHEAVYANGYIYVLGGGDDDTVVYTTVYFAKVNADGTLGSWQTASNALPAARQNTSAVVANGFVYVIGGRDDLYDTVSTVYYAKLNADGTVGTWSTAANALPAIRSYTTSVVANGYVYVVGGFDGTSTVSTVYYSKLNADGTVGTWSTAANALPAARSDATSVVANGYVYVVGGYNVTFESTVYYARLGGVVNVGGSLDLVGLQGQNLADPGDGSFGSTGGSIAAGNITAVGSLQVQGQASFGSSASIAGSFNAGNGLFSVDSGSGVVRVGPALADATAVVFVLDLKSSSDPTGVSATNGAMYYNSSLARFRCYENSAWRNCTGISVVGNTTATQSVTAGSDTYLTGSSVALPAYGLAGPSGGLTNGTLVTWRIYLSKTAAGTAASTLTLRVGTAGTTADTARCTAFSTGTATAAEDGGVITVTAYATAGGSSATLNCSYTLTHQLPTTGLANTPIVQAYSTAASFDSTPASTKMGLSFNAGTASVITIQKVEREVTNL